MSASRSNLHIDKGILCDEKFYRKSKSKIPVYNCDVCVIILSEPILRDFFYMQWTKGKVSGKGEEEQDKWTHLHWNLIIWWLNSRKSPEMQQTTLQDIYIIFGYTLIVECRIYVFLWYFVCVCKYILKHIYNYLEILSPG